MGIARRTAAGTGPSPAPGSSTPCGRGNPSAIPEKCRTGLARSAPERGIVSWRPHGGGIPMQDAGPEMLSIFAGAIERRSQAERAAFLDAACGADVGLRLRIEALLQAHEEAGGFLRDRTEAGDPAATVDQPGGEGPGTVIGPYKLLEKIGEGGF